MDRDIVRDLFAKRASPTRGRRPVLRRSGRGPPDKHAGQIHFDRNPPGPSVSYAGLRRLLETHDGISAAAPSAPTFAPDHEHRAERPGHSNTLPEHDPAR